MTEGAWELAKKYVRTTPTKPGRRFKVNVHVLVETDSPDGEMFWPMTMALRDGVDAEFAAKEIRRAITLAATEFAASAVARERGRLRPLFEKLSKEWEIYPDGLQFIEALHQLADALEVQF